MKTKTGIKLILDLVIFICFSVMDDFEVDENLNNKMMTFDVIIEKTSLIYKMK